jgi:DNA-binding MarR family transcriptional regulator
MSRKSPDPAVQDFAQSIGLLIRRVRAVSSSHELSWSQSAVMNRLANDGPATTADLARAEGVKPQSMGTIVAALEGRGFVTRRAHATDGRQFNIELTAEGAEIRRSAKDARHSWLADAIATLTDDERETLLAAGALMKRLADTQRR